jgi:hypothetical protein
MTDGWKAYEDLETINGGIYQHGVVVHEQNFVHPDYEEIHTQSIESMWCDLKKKIRRQRGTSEALFPSYIDEFVWRSHRGNKSVFVFLLQCIAQQYPL